jgi:hypothetical protein
MDLKSAVSPKEKSKEILMDISLFPFGRILPEQ